MWMFELDLVIFCILFSRVWSIQQHTQSTNINHVFPSLKCLRCCAVFTSYLNRTELGGQQRGGGNGWKACIDSTEPLCERVCGHWCEIPCWASKECGVINHNYYIQLLLCSSVTWIFLCLCVWVGDCVWAKNPHTFYIQFSLFSPLFFTCIKFGL